MTSKVQWVSRALVISPYYIGLCKTEEAFTRELKRMKLPKSSYPVFIPDGAGARVHFFEKGDGSLSAIVCITRPKGITKEQLNALLVHEAVHVWQEIRACLGEKAPSSEFEAYSIQSISQSLMQAFWATTTKESK